VGSPKPQLITLVTSFGTPHDGLTSLNLAYYGDWYLQNNQFKTWAPLYKHIENVDTVLLGIRMGCDEEGVAIYEYELP
jgi:hypothetical protein